MTKFYIAGHAIIEKDGRYLITRRSKKNDYMPLKWDVPGGTVESGETVEQAVVREVMEETKLKIDVGRVLYIYTNLDQLPDRQTCQTIYYCKYVNGTVTLNPDEHDNYSWVSKEEISKMDTIPFLKAFIGMNIL